MLIKLGVKIMSAKAILSSKGQVVIPKNMRNKLGLHSGSEFAISVKKKGVIELKPIAKNIKDFFGKGKRKSSLKDGSDIDELIMQAVIDNDRG